MISFATNGSCLLAHTEFVFADRRVQDDDEAEDADDADDDHDEADDDDEDESEYDNDDEEDKNTNVMPPKLKTPPKQPAKASPKQEAAGVDKIVSGIAKKLKITGPKPYSLSNNDPYMVKYYTHKFVDFVEVDFYVAGVLPQHGYKAELGADGMSLKWRRSIFDYFFESKRMIFMLGDAYNHSDSRVIAHDNVVQQVRKGGTENQGLHFASESEAQIVPFDVRCTGNPRVKETLQKHDVVVVGGHSHYQFYTIYSCKVRTMDQRSTQKKKARRSIFVDEVDDLSDEEDSDGGGGGDDDMSMTGPSNVGSGRRTGP
jgi:hypothetical protein